MSLIKSLAARLAPSFGTLSPSAARSTDFLPPRVFHSLPLSPNLCSPFLSARPKGLLP